MVTGDHHATAESIARRLQILQDHDSSNRVITGPIFDAMTPEQIQSTPNLPLVIARCSPESKVKLVQALHMRGEIVAMTGDGINDAPAIRMADVGASMGITGVDVTKNVSDIVLTDDNIATLVHAIEEGRNIALSIRKFVVHLITSNVAEVVVLMVGLSVKDDEGAVVFPLTPLEILWINMLTSTPPAIG
uniref:Calcium-transporting ATPase 3 n=1 Tax=Lygus hesperus TaxID=30085 RepID=A0A0A9XU27_LYGHE